MKYCPKCKTEYQDWAAECADCKVPLVNELPKELPPEENNEEFVTVYTNLLIPPVDMVRSALESEGILCLIKGYDESRPSLSFQTSIEVQVPEKDKAKAEQIIKDLGI